MPTSLARLAADPGVPVVAEDAPVSAHMATEVAALGADQAWAGLLGLPGVDGEGVGIAIIDSGIASQHEALRGRVVAVGGLRAARGSAARTATATARTSPASRRAA